MTTEPKNTDYLLAAPKHKAIPEPYATSGYNAIPEQPPWMAEILEMQEQFLMQTGIQRYLILVNYIHPA